MTALTRIPLGEGGSVLVEQPGLPDGGPVKAGRTGDTVRELPTTLEGALEPVTEAARAALTQLRKARPDEITIEFGVALTFEAGAVITKTQAGCHLKVTVSWKHESPGAESGSP
ncbi:CU044_2847 family protein [Streptomyces sp. NPDC053367]|uniref:CU044_2847 family protein n=1 Tax=Streptomyces sp. NPDC053367 TaxID=3365700 RepID=UPI0037D6E295